LLEISQIYQEKKKTLAQYDTTLPILQADFVSRKTWLGLAG